MPRCSHWPAVRCVVALSAFAVAAATVTAAGDDPQFAVSQGLRAGYTPTAYEAYAAEQLAGALQLVPGLNVTRIPAGSQRPPNTWVLAVGAEACEAYGLPPASLDGLGAEGYVVASAASQPESMAHGYVCVSGGIGAARGTLCVGPPCLCRQHTTTPPHFSLSPPHTH